MCTQDALITYWAEYQQSVLKRPHLALSSLVVCVRVTHHEQLLCRSYVENSNANMAEYGVVMVWQSACTMKSTKVQTLGELCMRGTANGWAGLLAFICGLPLVARRESDMG